SHLLYSNKESFALFIVYALAWRTWVPCEDMLCWTHLLVIHLPIKYAGINKTLLNIENNSDFVFKVNLLF
ncbi:hypothetical protein KPL33_13715, partial [Clostridium algidicarnis]|uniref:hypothetical protein n=1 Tax=Clostridium algidicarnis TaxID=37659 RepID=UPI001C0C0592